ncbi:flagellar hook-associated protein 3 [Halanaerobium sp. DL-01]|uniref:flagellar hook-associated protein FlgL n=1 Tax=Halanaerobium sp. DL-01 TaxID=1653064 RepID=UPI000DF241B2|nr:flagellar hook-associated protein FlgL [Halanaerobium sp. DL-01]RCW81665.1 flagellar hook-associated protein 3 [Halanaerobium sp. DL-01]
MRVTNSMMVKNMLDNLKTNFSDLNTLNGQLSSGKLFQMPSDAPIRVSDSMNFNSILNRNEQFKRNVGQAENWLNTTESALKSGTEVIQRARELTIYASSDSMTADDRKKIASEFKELRDELIDISKSKLGDSYIFSGQKTDQEPFTVEKNGIGDYVKYNGDNKDINRRMNDNVKFGINLSGEKVFKDEIEALNKIYNDLSAARAELQSTKSYTTVNDLNTELGDTTAVNKTFSIKVDGGTEDVVTFDGNYTGADAFESFEDFKSFVEAEVDGVTVEFSENDNIIFKSNKAGASSSIEITNDPDGILGVEDLVYGSDDGCSGETIGKNLSDMDKAINKFTELRAEVGAKLNRTGNIESRLEANEVHLKKLKSNNEDVDIAEVITNLKMEETVYRASLASGARIMQQSLIDFIK